MKAYLLAACVFILSAFQPAKAFEPPVPGSAIFNFEDENRISLETYNQKYLKGHGVYKEIPYNEADTSSGEELALKGFDILTAYKTACKAYFPKDLQQALVLPKKDGELAFSKFGKNPPFVVIKVRAKYFKIDVLQSAQILAEQEGGEHTIDIKLVDGGAKILYMTSEP